MKMFDSIKLLLDYCEFKDILKDETFQFYRIDPL